jgi:hypothetical protein
MIGAKQKSSFAKRLGWLVLIWLASIATLTLVSFTLKLLMNAAGFNS